LQDNETLIFSEHALLLQCKTMINESRLTIASIIGLNKEFEEQYIALHKHTFHTVLDRISRSHISDYSIFLHQGILFSHLVYTGTDYKADMEAIETDETSCEWWKLTDMMQQPLPLRPENKWWTEIRLWFEHEFSSPFNLETLRFAYTLPARADMPDTAPDTHFGDIDFWGATYDLKSLKIFKGFETFYIYLETSQTADHSFLLEILARVLKSETMPVMLKEVFHTETLYSTQPEPTKKYL
jgi:L-rhamnose mutarotase